MGNSIQTGNYDDAVNQVLEYFEANGIDPDTIDLDSAADLALYDDPVFEAYFQLAYQQLMEILYPEVINSLSAEVGEVNYDTLYANAGDEINELITLLLEDDPDLMLELTRMTQGDSEADYLAALLAATDSDSSGSDSGASYAYETSLTDDARDMIESGQVGTGFEWIVDQEDAFMAAEQSILDQLSEYDEAMVDLAEALANGMDPEVYQAELESMTMGREALLAMLQAVQDQASNFFQMISNLIENMIDTNLNIVRNLSS